MIKGKQRYKCKECGFNYTVEFKSTAKRPDERCFGLMLYLEGLGFHSIGRLLNVSHVSVINWIKKYGQQISEIRNDKAIGKVMSDYWKSYNEMVPKHQLIQNKKETFTVESYNGLIRHFLARFRRKTKCYTKSIEMMIHTLKLFFAKRNNMLSILNY